MLRLMNDMSASGAVSAKTAFFSLVAKEVDDALVAAGVEKWRGAQLRGWVYGKLVLDLGKMTGFSSALRQKLGEMFALTQGRVVRQQDSSDGTRKLLLEWGEGHEHVAETVMIPDQERRTACISSQVGCPVGCRFCASGMAGAKGNLSADQIVEQIIQLNLLLAPAGERISNIVFMGMGEPLANYAAVMQAVRVLHDPGCLNLGARRITISTVGVPKRMLELAQEDLPLNLAISLHAPNEALRKQLIPWAEHFSLAEILDAARQYFEKTGREVTLEYILLAGVNDRPEHARQLAKICKTLRANVNLIRYNEVEGIEFRRPSDEAVRQFQATLREGGVNAHVRKSRGRDIDAACGQLRRNATTAG
jgi:23S rRNA (adenine2503-C2)-methyltransferase